MKIAVIIHSHTFNTLAVAERLEKALQDKGQHPYVDNLELKGDYKPGAKKIKFGSLPKIEDYNMIVFGAPVEAFSLSPVMKKYLKEKVPSLKGKWTFLFVTKALPGNWTGGNNAIRQMKGLVKKKGGDVADTGIVRWREKTREMDIQELVSNLIKLL